LGPLPVSTVDCIPTFYGGNLQKETWSRLLRTGVAMFESSADFQHNPWEAELVHRLADAGVRINFRLFWWWQFYNGEVAWNTSIVDLYYNETLMGLLEGFVDGQLNQLDPEKIWAVTLSEEEPGYSLRYFWAPTTQRRYNYTFHEETGYWLRGQYGLNGTEERVLYKWLSEKTVRVFNHLYDRVKGRWPHVFVFQFIVPSPGASPVWGGGLDLTGLKADALKADLYYYDVYDNPFWLYEYVRHTKTTFPDEEYHFWLWGEEPWEEGGLAGGFEHIRRNAWVTYLAGVDAVGWFNWHYERGVMWERDDVLGKQLIEYTNRLSRELGKLPTFRPRPEVLVIRDVPMSFQLGLCCDLGAFHEWDSADQLTVARGGIDLSQYRLIVANEAGYLDGAVEWLNDYVRSGGNLLLLGGFGRGQSNLYGNATRETLFLMEEGVTQKEIWGETLVEISKSNPLDLELKYKQEVGGDCILGLELGTLTDDHQAIGNFYEVVGGVSLKPLDSSPLVLYHNSSSSGEGWVLYWGGLKTRTTPDGGQVDVVEAFMGELNHTRLVYREMSRAFAGGFLGLKGCVTTAGKENIMITQSEVDEGVVLAGIMNNYPQRVDLDYVLDLGRFDLPPGEYWVHSLDQNTSLGRYVSQGSVLDVPVSVGGMETRLLLISRQKPEPSYSVDTHPDVPSPEEVAGLWRPWLTVLSEHGEVTGGGPYNPGERASFGVSETVPGEEGVRYVFEGWISGDEEGYAGGDNPAAVVMNGDVTEIAGWKTQYYLTIQAEEGRSVAPGSGWHDAGSELVIEAEPGGGFDFVSWMGGGEGSYSGSELSHTVLMNGPVTETATFLDVEPPVAYVFIDREIGVGVKFVLDARGSRDNARIISYEWDLGEGITAMGPVVIHSYGTPGERTITLTVKDAVGNSDSDTVAITVREAAGPGGPQLGVPPWVLFVVGLAVALGLLPYLIVKATSGEK
jgi:hypothetical protein